LHFPLLLSLSSSILANPLPAHFSVPGNLLQNLLWIYLILYMPYSVPTPQFHTNLWFPFHFVYGLWACTFILEATDTHLSTVTRVWCPVVLMKVFLFILASCTSLSLLPNIYLTATCVFCSFFPITLKLSQHAVLCSTVHENWPVSMCQAGNWHCSMMDRQILRTHYCNCEQALPFPF